MTRSPQPLIQPDAATCAALSAPSGWAPSSFLTMNINEQVAEIPWWKRFLICHLNRSKWKVARAYNTVGVDLLNGADWELGDIIRKHGDVKWAELYGVDAPKPDNAQWQSRAVSAEHDLEWTQKRCKQLEEQVALLKKTSRGMQSLRRQRPLPNVKSSATPNLG